MEGAANEDGRTPSIRDTYVHAGQFSLFYISFQYYAVDLIGSLFYLSTNVSFSFPSFSVER